MKIWCLSEHTALFSQRLFCLFWKDCKLTAAILIFCTARPGHYFLRTTRHFTFAQLTMLIYASHALQVLFSSQTEVFSPFLFQFREAGVVCLPLLMPGDAIPAALSLGLMALLTNTHTDTHINKPTHLCRLGAAWHSSLSALKGFIWCDFKFSFLFGVLEADFA